MNIKNLKVVAACAVAVGSLVAVATPHVAHADTSQTECQLIQGPLPGANIQVGPVQESVPSISQLNVCLTVDVPTAGLPTVQTVSGCGFPCFEITASGAPVGAIVTASASWIDNGTTPQSASYTVPVTAGETYPICLSVGSPAPACPGSQLNLTEAGIVSFGV